MVYLWQELHPGLDYFLKELATDLKESLEVLKHCHIFSPKKAHIMQPDVDAVSVCLQSLSFFKILPDLEIDALKKELSTYLACSADIDDEFSPVEWWKLNSIVLPAWSKAVKKYCYFSRHQLQQTERFPC